MFGAGVLVLAVMFWQGSVVTVVPVAGPTVADSYPSAGLAFQPNAYVERIWPKQIVAMVRKDAVPLPQLLSALAKDKAAALTTYGNKVGDAYNILVSFSGTVGKIDTSTPMGMLTVDTKDNGKSVPVQVAVGPVILGTTLRDALKFISFGEFLNQIQYGDVSDALNNMVTSKIVTPKEAANLRGQAVTIFGAYTYNDSDPQDITVTPVILERAKGSQ